MEIAVESVVLSLRGHDKGGTFAVIGFADETHALIADGKRRKIEKPKKKQLKHLRAIGRLTLPSPCSAMNRQLKKALEVYKPTVSGGGI